MTYMTYKEFANNVRSNILGTYIDGENNESVMYFDFNESKQQLFAGTCANFGIKPIVSVPYDSNNHIDSNIEMLHEMLAEIGYVLID